MEEDVAVLTRHDAWGKRGSRTRVLVLGLEQEVLGLQVAVNDVVLIVAVLWVGGVWWVVDGDA